MSSLLPITIGIVDLELMVVMMSLPPIITMTNDEREVPCETLC
jgi:hypothetical protein